MNELLCHLHHDPPHILCVTEHHLHHDELASLHIENYKLGAYCYIKSKHRGCVCMSVCNSVTFTSLNIGNYCLDQDFEVCAIHLNSVYDKLCILDIYRSLLGNFSTFLTNFDFILHKFLNLKFNSLYVETLMLTHCRRLTQKCVIAHPCVVDGPRISAFSYTTSNTRIFELVWHTDRFKVIVSYMQDVCISSYKQTDRSWTLL